MTVDAQINNEPRWVDVKYLNISHLTYSAFDAVGRVDDYMTMLIARHHETRVAAGLEIRR